MKDDNRQNNYQEHQNRERPQNFERRGSRSPSFFAGQAFSLVYNLGVLYLVYKLINQEQVDLALKVFFGNLALIAFALVVTKRKDRPHHHNRRRHNSGRRDRRFSNKNGSR